MTSFYLHRHVFDVFVPVNYWMSLSISILAYFIGQEMGILTHALNNIFFKYLGKYPASEKSPKKGDQFIAIATALAEAMSVSDWRQAEKMRKRKACKAWRLFSA